MHVDRRHKAIYYAPGPLCSRFEVIWTIAEAGDRVADDLLETGYTWVWRSHKERFFADWEERLRAGHTAGEAFHVRPLTRLTGPTKQDFLTDLQHRTTVPAMTMEIFALRDQPAARVSDELIQLGLRNLNEGVPGPIAVAIEQSYELDDQDLCLAQPVDEIIAELLSRWGTGPLCTPEANILVEPGPRRTLP